MATCFVIQPFDKGKFDKRYKDVFCPAIKAAELEPYRVDQDPGVEVPIESIERGIEDASICLADITTDNPNVWYELGYAFAASKPVVMVCGEEREGDKFPFDIQHRMILRYQSQSASDFQTLQNQITERIEALLAKGERLRRIAQSDPVAEREGLSQPELAVLAAIAGDAAIPETRTSMWSLKNDVEKAGFTSIGFAIGIRELINKGFVEVEEEVDDHGDQYSVGSVTERGWAWIQANPTVFSLKKPSLRRNSDNDDIPF